MVCAGYMHLDVEEPEAGDPAKEGTAAGEYLQYLLERKPIGIAASNGVYFDEDMKFHTHPLASDIFSRAKSEITCEQRVDWQTRSGIWIKGQPDATYVDHRDYLCVDDLKYGWGIVEVKENWQIIGYAIGECIKRGRAFTHIAFRIMQPRPHHEDGYIREWIITYAELLGYMEKIEARMQQLADGLRDYQTSEKCKYCKGAAEACTAFNRLFYRALEVSTEFVQDKLTNEEIAVQLDQIRRAEEVIKIKSDSLKELAVSKIKKGQIIPGYMSEQTYGHRNWKKGVSPVAIQAMTGKDVMEKSFMSPAKAEKLGVSKELISQWSEAPFTGMKLKRKDATEVGNKVFGNNAPVMNY